MRPTTLQDVLALVTSAASSGMNAVAHMPAILKGLQELPPPDGELVTRAEWDRAAHYSWAAIVENLEPGRTEPVNIRAPHDLWVRGMVAGAIPIFAVGDSTLDQSRAAIESGVKLSASNYRACFDVSYKLNNSEGFITAGLPDVETGASQVAGDGRYLVPMDWHLEKQDVVSIRITNTTDKLFAAIDQPGVRLRQVHVVFWAIQLTGRGRGLDGGI